MGAFDPLFSDIDNTKEGHAYVVDSNGWGWFALFILIALPFFILSLLLKKYANAVCKFPAVATLIYCLVALVVSFIFYSDKRKRFRLIGIIATMLSMVPMAAVQVIYAIPYILTHDGIFSIMFEWLLVTVLTLGITVFVISIGNLCRNGLIHLGLSIVFLIIVAAMLRPPEDVTWEYIKHLYTTN